MTYEVRLKGGEVEMVDRADSYQQEGPLTTFFLTRPGRNRRYRAHPVRGLGRSCGLLVQKWGKRGGGAAGLTPT